jgi:4-hydroxy-3-methylbut-2-enyl diphosphate reductase IspH
MKTHKEASNIFSFDAFIDCNEIKRRKANKTKKLANRRSKLLVIVGKNNSSNKKKIAV